MSEAYLCFQKGLAALAAGRADEAIVPLERARRLQPDSMSITEALGKAYLSVRFYDRAVEAFTEIVEREPLDDYAHYCLARAYDRLGNESMASRHYQLARSLKPSRTLYGDTLRAFQGRVGMIRRRRPVNSDDDQRTSDSGEPRYRSEGA